MFVKKLDKEPVLLGEACVVSLPLGEILTSQFGFKEIPVKVTGKELPVDLIVLKMVDYDVILAWIGYQGIILPSFVEGKRWCSNHMKEKCSSIRAGVSGR